MASKSPTITPAANSTTVPALSVWGGVNAVAAALKTNGTHFANRSGFKLGIWYFADVDDTDVWDNSSTIKPPKHLVAVAWQADQADTDKVGASITAAESGTTSATVTFDAENANSVGWLWTLSGQ